MVFPAANRAFEVLINPNHPSYSPIMLVSNVSFLPAVDNDWLEMYLNVPLVLKVIMLPAPPVDNARVFKSVVSEPFVMYLYFSFGFRPLILTLKMIGVRVVSPVDALVAPAYFGTKIGPI